MARGARQAWGTEGSPSGHRAVTPAVWRSASVGRLGGRRPQFVDGDFRRPTARRDHGAGSEDSVGLRCDPGRAAGLARCAAVVGAVGCRAGGPPVDPPRVGVRHGARHAGSGRGGAARLARTAPGRRARADRHRLQRRQGAVQRQRRRLSSQPASSGLGHRGQRSPLRARCLRPDGPRRLAAGAAIDRWAAIRRQDPVEAEPPLVRLRGEGDCPTRAGAVFGRR